ncbi:hypothetical protein B0J11DRAFT_542535 [Dendryphion nanum]|uniref:Uncharacterized protein n=1 Tax=Dendryphion nanum TaxID=256645 RepID=A0A9P9D506_9PLEO|nr:hypothetical protein B0J11DRAFT_542535 [Dendryphion nanum]
MVHLLRTLCNLSGCVAAILIWLKQLEIGKLPLVTLDCEYLRPDVLQYILHPRIPLHLSFKSESRTSQNKRGFSVTKIYTSPNRSPCNYPA